MFRSTKLNKDTLTRTHTHTARCTTVWGEPVHWLCLRLWRLCICAYAVTHAAAHTVLHVQQNLIAQNGLWDVLLVITNEIAALAEGMLMLRLCNIRLLSQRNHESAASIGQPRGSAEAASPTNWRDIQTKTKCVFSFLIFS